MLLLPLSLAMDNIELDNGGGSGGGGGPAAAVVEVAAAVAVVNDRDSVQLLGGV